MVAYPRSASRISTGQQDVVQTGREISTLPAGEPNASIVMGQYDPLLGFDTEQDVVTLPTMKAGNVALPAGAVVGRGRYVGRQRPMQPQFDGVPRTPQNILTGASLLSYASRTHQMTSALSAFPGRVYYAWYALNGTPNGPNAETWGNYIVIARSDDYAATEPTEIAHIAPADLANDRLSDPFFITDAGRLFCFYRQQNNTLGARAGGLYCVEIANPMAANATPLILGPWPVEYDLAMFQVDMPGGPYIGTGYDGPVSGYVPEFVGKVGHFICRFVPPTLEWPAELERISRITDVSAALDVSPEASVVALSAGRMFMQRRTTSGAYHSVGTRNVDGTITWPTPTAWTAITAPVATRNWVARTPRGRIIAVYNNHATLRQNLTAALWYDDATFPASAPDRSLLLQSSTSQYPAGAFMLDTAGVYNGIIQVGYDTARGQSAGSMQMSIAEFDEDDFAAGTASVTTRVMSPNN